MFIDVEAVLVGIPDVLKGSKEILDCDYEEQATFRGALFASAFKWYVVFRLASPQCVGQCRWYIVTGAILCIVFVVAS